MLVNMGRVLGQLALKYGDSPALINLERDRRFSFRQMHALSNRLSNCLTGRFGLKAGDIYATILDNDNMGLFHPWMLKCPVAGAWMDVRDSQAELLARLDHTRPRLVFMESRFLPTLGPELAAREIIPVCMDPGHGSDHGALGFWDLMEEAPSHEVEAEFEFNDARRHTCVLRFTGGTTGQAKCAMYSLANLWSWGCNPAHYYETFPYDRPRALLFSPIHHAASGSVIIPVLIKGGALITLNKAELDQLGQAVAGEKAQMIYAVPTVLYRMLDQELHRRHDLSSLRTIRYGAAPISPAKLEALLEVFGPVFVQGYGSTECWPSCTILGRAEHATATDRDRELLTSVGRPMPGQEILICDETGQPLPPGAPGELWIRGINTICGYYQAPELNREHFSPGGFWKSGDIGMLDPEGFVYLIDRKKDLIISGGYNVYASEVENCLNAHPSVQNCAVVGLPDAQWGEAVCAAVVLANQASATADQLIEHCKQNLARYKAPKTIRIVQQLPLSPAGKVLRRKVREEMQE